MAAIEKQIRRVRAEMATRPAGLRAHVDRVLVEALRLGSTFDVDRARIELATLGHDLFRAYRPAEQLRLAEEAGLPLSAADRASPIMLHGPIAASVLRERFKVADEEVLAAVRDHTSGSPGMPLLASIILIADKVERRKRKRSPAMAAVRRLARRDLDVALLCWADWKWVEERTRGWDSYPGHWEARLAWVAAHHAEIALPGRVHEDEWLAAMGC
jgi:predicted HD superfamily hydrolase involved in NAD metabolism